MRVTYLCVIMLYTVFEYSYKLTNVYVVDCTHVVVVVYRAMKTASFGFL